MRLRYTGWLEAGKATRDELPEFVSIPTIGKQFEVELQRQQDKKPNGIQ